MAAFRFRLARLERVRAVGEELARARWLAAGAELAKADKCLSEARFDVDEALDMLARDRMSPTLDARAQLTAEAALQPLEVRVAAARRRSARASEIEREQRATWHAARADWRALRELERRAHDAFVRELARVDEREMEELCGRIRPVETTR